MKTNIIVNLQWEAIHSWSKCPLPEVAFLKHPHRHIFHICAKKEVTHDDRQVEIIMFKRKILEYLNQWDNDLGDQSCEMLAKELAHQFELSYCSVLEDGENGAEVCVQ